MHENYVEIPAQQVTKEGTTWSPYFHLARTGSIVTRVSLSEQRLELLARTHLVTGGVERL